MLKDSDDRLKKLLKESEDITVPKKITDGIDNTLRTITYKKVNKIKKIAVMTAVISIIIIPLGVGAYKQVQETYVPSLGETIKSDSTIYLLEKSITKRIASRKVTLKDIYYNKEGKMIIVKVEGNGKLPANNSKLKINNTNLNSVEGNIYTSDSDRVDTSWDAIYIFEYDKDYNNKHVKFELVLDNGEKAKFKTKLNQAKEVKDINELGPTSTSKGIEITAVVEEEDNKLDITLLNNLEEDIWIASYGFCPNYNYDYNYMTLVLEDANGNTSTGKIDKTKDSNTYNRFTFNTTNITKPYEISISEVEIHIDTMDNKDMIASEELELTIPKNNEKLLLNKIINLKTNSELLKGSDKEVNLVSIERNDDECIIEIDYPDKSEEDLKLLRSVITPSGKSTTPQGEDWFESGLSGGATEEGNETISFTLPYPNEDKLYIKVLGSIYRVKGDWSITIE